MNLPVSQRHAKLRRLAEDLGYGDVQTLLDDYTHDCVVPAICTAPGCDCVADMEPDQDRGYCELCGRNTVASALVLAGLA